MIEIDGLSKRYGAVEALKSVTLDIQQGEFVSLLGPSGCGKTTLLRIIAGFITPTGGDLRIDEQSMLGVPPNKRPVNTVFQNYALFPHMTVAENIAFGPKRRKVDPATIARDVAEALAMVSMEGYGERFPRALSGGQQQRIALARAIINKPRVLLLDEPLGALDLKLRKRMQYELKRLHHQLGITFIYVTHDQEEALAMSDRIAVMRQGRVMQFGTGEDIYRRPNSGYVADFIGEANLIRCVRGARGLSLSADGPPLPLDSPAEGTLLVVRPEQIRIGKPPSDRACIAAEATVIEKTYLGHSWHITATLEGGQDIAIHADETADTTALASGARVPLWWAAEHALVVDE